MEKDLLEGFARYLEPQTALVRSRANNQVFPSIAISRQMGAGGREIGELLSNRLADYSQQAWTVFDRNLAELIWKNHNLPDLVERFLREEVPNCIQDAVQEL